MNNSVKKLLFLSLQDICYNSTGYFEKRISDELAACGIEITHLKLPKASDMAYAILKPYLMLIMMQLWISTQEYLL